MASGPPFPPPYHPDPQGPPVQSTYPPAPPGQHPWLPPATLSGTGSARAWPGEWPGQPRRPALYELRPLSTGEVLDRTFSLFRSRFLLFAGIASVAAVVRLIGTGAQLGVQATLLRGGTLAGIGVANNLISLGASILFLLAFAVTQAATMWAVGEVYLGRDATISASLRTVLPRTWRYLGISLWQMWSAGWPALAVLAVFGTVWLLGGRSFGTAGQLGAVGLMVLLLAAAFVVGTIFYLRNLLGVPAAVSEGLGVRAAMRRSKALSQGAKGKLFLVLLISAALYMVMGIVMSIAMIFVYLFHRGSPATAFTTGSGLIAVGAVTLVVVFIGYTVISPVIMVGVSLVYFDQRVRKEAFDVAVLLGEGTAVAAQAGVAVPVMMPGPVAVETAAPPVFSAERPGLELAEAPVAEPPGGASGS